MELEQGPTENHARAGSLRPGDGWHRRRYVVLPVFENPAGETAFGATCAKGSADREDSACASAFLFVPCGNAGGVALAGKPSTCEASLSILSRSDAGIR